MEGHGIPAAAATARPRGGSPTSLPAGVTQSQLRAARQACQNLLPQGAFGGGRANSPQAAAYRNCLGLHGVTLPARSTSSTTTPGATPSPSFDPNSPTVKAAMQACAALRPQAGPSTTTSTT